MYLNKSAQSSLTPFHTMTPNDVKIVADNIDDFIEVPNGVDRLRKAVLALAVSGKFVAEDKSDGSAEDLYKKIQTKRLSQKKEVVEYHSLTKKEAPFEIPSSWKWVRLGEVCEFVYGDGLPKEERKEDGKYKAYGANGPLAQTNLTNCEIGGVIVGRKGSAGAVTLVSEPFFATDVTYFIPSGQYGAFETNYLYYLLLALDLPQHAKGIKPGISRKEVYELPVALPPLTAQRRIIKKIEQVMSQLDDLEARKLERDEVCARLARSAMQSLGKGESKIAFEQMSELIKTPADIKELEGALLTLAVSGKLVPQDKSDGTAEELYAKIRSERSVSTRKRKTQELQLPKPTETSFDIPKSWKWIRLGDCMDISSGDSLKVSEATEGKYLVYGGNGIAGRHTESNASKGTIVIGRVGALCGIAHITETDAWVTDNAFIVSYPEKFLDRHFFALLLNQLNLRKSHRGSAQPVISGISVYPIPMPLPPLVEQKRIVKKVEDVMVLVAQLREAFGENKASGRGRPKK